MKDETKFWDRIAKRYSKKPVPSQEIYEEKLKKTQAVFTPEMKVLEVGCGTGTTSLIHAPFVKNIIATDFSSTAFSGENLICGIDTSIYQYKDVFEGNEQAALPADEGESPQTSKKR